MNYLIIFLMPELTRPEENDLMLHSTHEAERRNVTAGTANRENLDKILNGDLSMMTWRKKTRKLFTIVDGVPAMDMAQGMFCPLVGDDEDFLVSGVFYCLSF